MASITTYHFFKFLLEFFQDHYCELEIDGALIQFNFITPEVMSIRNLPQDRMKVLEEETGPILEYLCSPPKGFASFRKQLHYFLSVLDRSSNLRQIPIFERA